MNKLIMVVPYDTVSCLNGNPRIYNNINEFWRHLDIIANSDPTLKDVQFKFVGLLFRNEKVYPVEAFKEPFVVFASDDRDTVNAKWKEFMKDYVLDGNN